ALFLLIVPLEQPQNSKLIGTWKVVKIQSADGFFIPKIDFILNISEDKFTFNRDVNQCSANPTITENTIEFDGSLCTRACCDGRKDPVGALINYSGYYIVTENSLTIQSDYVKTWLKRIESNIK